MVSYYNTLSYPQKHSAANLAYTASQPWQWATNYHTPPNPQFLGEMESPHPHHQMYYNPHMFHTPTSEWHSPTSSAENYSPQNVPNAHQMLQHQHPNNLIGGGGSGGGSGGIGGGNGNIIGNNNGPSSTGSSGSSSASAGPGSGNTQLNETASSIGETHHIAEGLPSPPITVSGSEISSPGAPASSSSPHHVSHLLHNNNNSPSTNNNNNNNNNNSTHNNNNNRQSSPVKSHYYDWMKKPSYPAQPTPGSSYTDDELCTNVPTLQDFTDILDSSGKTRTKDKYRVVYTDFQRLELEKEYCTARYITIRRKTELAQTLSLSERQVKIWFQNRRAKERKQNKKGNDPTALSIQQQHHDYPNMMDTKPKLEPGLQHLQHSMSSLHSMSSMAAMTMPALGLHHHHHHLHGHHHSLAMSAHSSAAHHQSLHQSPHSHSHTHSQMSAAAAVAAASVGSLPM